MSPNHHDWERADIYQEENAKLRADNEALREEVEALRLVATSHEPEALRLQADNERLRVELARIRGLPRLAALDAEIEHLRSTLGYLADNISDYPALVAVAEAALKPRP